VASRGQNASKLIRVDSFINGTPVSEPTMALDQNQKSLTGRSIQPMR
jgi:hypothetical protein